jgi:Tfp pilus assembly protein PilN
MIEFNLLPDVKQQFIKARRTKRLIISVSFIAAAVALFIFIFLLVFVDVFQKARISNLHNQIASSKSQIQGKSNLNEILTIQNQLKTLPSIYGSLPASNRLSNYLTELIPANATISSLSLNYSTNNILISGAADSSATVAQLVDTLKFATYTLNGQGSTPAFSAVAVTSIALNTSATSGSSKTTYALSFNFDPKLFNPSDNTQLVVPSLTTNRSILNQPADLFKSNGGT